MRCAIFDLDGTLADTAADLLNAANAVFETDPLDLSVDHGVAVRGGMAMLTLAFERLGWPADPAELLAYQDRFRAVYAEALHVETRLYDGVEAALERLAAAGWALGVCTNKPVHMAEPLLTSLGIRGRFQAVLGAGSLKVVKPDPLHLTEAIRLSGGVRERSVLIGDSVTDRDAARNAQVPCVLVGFGPAGEGISMLEPAAVLPHYDQLPDLLDRLIA